MLSVARTAQRQMAGWLVNNKVGRMRKEAIEVEIVCLKKTVITLRLGGALAEGWILILPNAKKSVTAWTELLVQMKSRSERTHTIDKIEKKEKTEEGLQRNRTNDRKRERGRNRAKLKRKEKRVGQCEIYTKGKRKKERMKQWNKKKEDMKGDLHTRVGLDCWNSAQSELPCKLRLDTVWCMSCQRGDKRRLLG